MFVIQDVQVALGSVQDVLDSALDVLVVVAHLAQEPALLLLALIN